MKNLSSIVTEALLPLKKTKKIEQIAKLIGHMLVLNWDEEKIETHFNSWNDRACIDKYYVKGIRLGEEDPSKIMLMCDRYSKTGIDGRWELFNGYSSLDYTLIEYDDYIIKNYQVEQ